MSNWRAVIRTSALVVVMAARTQSVFAEEHTLGHHNRAEIEKACSDAKGVPLDGGKTGSYGCEVPSKGTMVLCNKHESCTGYTPARTQKSRDKVLRSLRLKVAVAK
jgi:hypothetical protein